MKKKIKLLALAIAIIASMADLGAEAKGKISVGDKAPDFELMSQDEKLVKLSDFRGKKVVLFFYPKDDTGVCKKQACAFRDSYDVFIDEGAEVIGISGDSIESHQEFANKRKLPFTLLSDPKGRVGEEFGVRKFLGFLRLGRVTFVIDKDGVVRHRFSALLKAQEHIDQALEVVKSL